MIDLPKIEPTQTDIASKIKPEPSITMEMPGIMNDVYPINLDDKEKPVLPTRQEIQKFRRLERVPGDDPMTGQSGTMVRIDKNTKKTNEYLARIATYFKNQKTKEDKKELLLRFQKGGKRNAAAMGLFGVGGAFGGAMGDFGGGGGSDDDSSYKDNPPKKEEEESGGMSLLDTALTGLEGYATWKLWKAFKPNLGIGRAAASLGRLALTAATSTPALAAGGALAITAAGALAVESSVGQVIDKNVTKVVRDVTRRKRWYKQEVWNDMDLAIKNNPWMAKKLQNNPEWTPEEKALVDEYFQKKNPTQKTEQKYNENYELPEETNKVIESMAKKEGVDPAFLKAIAQIESSGNVNSNRNKPTQYKGLFQLGNAVGKGIDRFDAIQNTKRAIEIFKRNRANFIKYYHREPTRTELYLMHQQGPTGTHRLLNNPDKRVMDIGTNAKGNMDSITWEANGGDNMTAKQFHDAWQKKIEDRHAYYSNKPQKPTVTANPKPTPKILNLQPKEVETVTVKPTESKRTEGDYLNKNKQEDETTTNVILVHDRTIIR